MEVLAPAKINLTLCVLGKRLDGYHELESVMQKLTLADTLYIEEASGLEFACSEPSLTDNDNLVLRAARLLRVHFGCQRGAKIYLKKRIPVQAGLGGGSSDGAAALQALNALWELHLTPSKLAVLAEELGSDVPFFLNGATAVVRGRGEQVKSVVHHLQAHVVLVKPEAGLSTTDVYAKLYAAPLPSPVPAQQTAETDIMLSALASGKPAAVADALLNDLEESAMPLLPELIPLRSRLLRQGCLGVLLCGSGSALFGICPDAAIARKAADALAADGTWTTSTTFAVP